MFEAGGGSWPFGKKGCCIATYVWCPIALAAGPQAPCLHYYVVKARYKVAEKAGFPKESCCTAWMNTIALGLSIAQINREIVIRGWNPKAKKPGVQLAAGGAPMVASIER